MKKKQVIAVSEQVDFLRYKALKQIPARIDTGARTSSLWASNVRVEDNIVTLSFFGPSSPYYTGKVIRVPLEGTRVVTSSTGVEQERLIVKLPIRIHGRRIKAKFTLSDRSTQVYPILIGRNTLRGNFLVDSADPGTAAIYKDPTERDEFNQIEEGVV